MEGSRQQRHRNTALLLIGAGLFLLLQKWVGFGTLAALLLLILGVYRIAAEGDKKGFAIAGIGAVILISRHFMVIVAFVLVSLGLFYMNNRRIRRDGAHIRKHKLADRFKRDKDPWILRNMSLWNVVGEMNLDLSLAMPEQRETTLVLQGILGDIDILLPEDWGVDVSVSVGFGRMNVLGEQETGILNKIEWRSPRYEECEHKVKLIISYAVGDIDIRML